MENITDHSVQTLTSTDSNDQHLSLDDNPITTDTDEGYQNHPTTFNSYSTQTYTNSGKIISQQIKEDKDECRSLITKYGVDAHEMMHLLHRWTHELIEKYKRSRERFKLLLKEKWDQDELKDIKSHSGLIQRHVYERMQELEKWRPTLNEQLNDNNMKEIIGQAIDQLFQILESIIFIHKNAVTDQMKAMRSLDHFDDIREQLRRLRRINEKEYNTICIIGLEKAGKSSFINALLGFELLPFKPERCTQIQTVLKPLSKQNPNLFATVEFYSQDEFTRLIAQIQQRKEETESEFQQRISSIQQTRQKDTPYDTLIQSFTSSDENEYKKNLQKIHTFIANEVYLTIVKQVTIYTDKLPGKNYELLDVPGCDSPIAEHRVASINAVLNADAFLFLTDGQRPSLTNDQVNLLNEIRKGHFDGIKRAFGIITKLDLCQTRDKFIEHRDKSLFELEQKGFLRKNIFTVSSYLSLLEETQSNLSDLQQIKERIARYDLLPDGFDLCKKALGDYIENELPNTRLQQVHSIAHQKFVRYIQEALKLGRQLIPIDTQQTTLDDYIQRINAENWDEIFDKERYQPVLARAAYWTNDTLTVHRDDCAQALISYFSDRFQACTQDVINKNHPVEQMMLERPEVAAFQMNPYTIDFEEREKITLSMFKAMEGASNELAIYMFDTYVSKVETLLGEICPEQPGFFQDDLTISHCSIEVRTLVLRIGRPIIMATVHWPHISKNLREEAAKELIRCVPTIAFNEGKDQGKTSFSGQLCNAFTLAETIGTILSSANPLGKGTIPMKILVELFRH